MKKKSKEKKKKSEKSVKRTYTFSRKDLKKSFFDVQESWNRELTKFLNDVSYLETIGNGQVASIPSKFDDIDSRKKLHKDLESTISELAEYVDSLQASLESLKQTLYTMNRDVSEPLVATYKKYESCDDEVY